MKFIPTLPALVVLSFAIGLAQPSASAETGKDVEPLERCFLDAPEDIDLGTSMDCGYVVVAQNRQDNGMGEIRLAYTRLNAIRDTGAAPLFMLAGGPGRALTGDPAIFMLFQSPFLGPLLETRDIVLLEQRGTLRARPHLDCPEFWSLSREAVEQGFAQEDDFGPIRDRMAACVARHEDAGVELAAYNNIENAADVNDVRKALGYDRIIYYGASYGTELGQHVMRDFPETLEAVVLDGTGALTVTDWSAGQARNAQWGIDNLTRLCAKDTECAADYDIPALVEAALTLFDEGPIAATFTPPEEPETRFELEFTEEEFATYLRSLQTSKYGVVTFPALLNAYATEGRSRLGADMAAQRGAQLLVDPKLQDADTSILMHLAMICSDDPPRSLEDIATDGFGRYEVLFARESARLYVEMCDLLDLPQLPPRVDAPVTTDVPVLVLSGGLDIQTPYFVSQGVVDNLPNATHVIFPAGFHVQVMTINPCAIRIARDFITDPTLQPDLSCVAEEQPLPFMRPDFTMPDTE